MGRKLYWTRQYFYLYLASLIFFVLFGCATPEETGKDDIVLYTCPKPETTVNDDIVDKNILQSRELLSKGDYKGALIKIQDILSFPRHINKDEALFQAGLIFAHYMNPDKDFKKSRDYFTKLIIEHPKSRLVEQAKIWVGMLDLIEKAKQVDIDIEKKRKELTQ